jgi:hypothetical protein
LDLKLLDGLVVFAHLGGAPDGGLARTLGASRFVLALKSSPTARQWLAQSVAIRELRPAPTIEVHVLAHITANPWLGRQLQLQCIFRTVIIICGARAFVRLDCSVATINGIKAG